MSSAEPALEFPTGTLTFLFIDLEGSTRLWEQHPESMKTALARHDALLRVSVERNDGLIVKTTGDGLHAMFQSASNALNAALNAQQDLVKEVWATHVGEIRVRIGLHTGERQFREGDYYGTTVNRAARIIQDSLPPECSLLDLGQHTLKDLSRSGNIFQLCHPDLQAEFPPIKSLAAFRNNLPLQLTSFVGREGEMIRIHELLAENRLLTLAGPGGTGKTRLMLQAAAGEVEDYKDGVWLVELAPLADPDRLWERLAAVLKVQELPGRPLPETLLDYLRSKKALLLIDNVEHLVHDAALLAERLVSTCPDIRVLVTGREPLNIDGEQVLQIPPLPVPEGAGQTSVEQIRASPAVRLFIERAQSAWPDFDLTPSNARALEVIARRQDGIPLAIELAAARTQILTVKQIAARLDDRFRLLADGRRTALPRQRTLQALIDWSWDLLEEQEQILLRRLSVFSGGWTLEAAEAVAGQGLAGVLEDLAQLAAKSLVVVDTSTEGPARYHMLESIREYAWERLTESGERARLEEQHADYYRAFAEEAAEQLRGPEVITWLGLIRREGEHPQDVKLAACA